MPAVATTIEPFALSPREAAKCLAVSKRTISRLITARKIVARKVGSRTLVDVASLKGYYQSLRLTTDHQPLVFGRRAHVVLSPRQKRH
jgi:excisionase family DNA binding protein